jgi:hypothetical protein
MVDWNEWHKNYADPDSEISSRLLAVRRLLAGALERAPSPATVISLCSGDGRDIRVLLAERPNLRVHARLVEFDDRLVAAGRSALAATGTEGIEFVQADAADMQNYADMAPADVLLIAGIFGNITDEDVFNTIDHSSQLVKPGGSVLWTRGRRSPDLTPAIRERFAEAGFEQVEFVAPPDMVFTVGCHRFVGAGQPLTVHDHLFTFIR